MIPLHVSSLFILLVTAAMVSAQATVDVTRAVIIGTGRGAGPGGPAFVPIPSGKPPDGVRLRLGSNLFRDPNYISGTALSPDGKLLAVCSGGQTIRFLELATGKEVRRINIREYLQTNQVFFTPDGNQLVSAGYSGINVWDAKDGRLVRQASPGRKDGRSGMIHLSADGKFAAMGNQYQDGNVFVTDVTTGTQVASVKPIQNAAVHGVMSPKGEYVATWGQHYQRGGEKQEDVQTIARTIQLWDTKTAQEKARLVSEIYQIHSVQFSPDGAKVAAGGNGLIQLWDIATGKLERRFAGRSGQGMKLVFSPDARLLSAAGQDGCVQTWEVATGKRAGICEGPAANVAGLQYKPDGQLLAWAVNANAIEAWEVPSGKRLTPQGGHTAAITAIQFSPDGKTLVSCGNDGKMLRWDLATGKELEPFELKESEAKRRMYGYPRGYTGPTHFSPNGRYLVASGSTGGGAAVWDVEAGLELFALTSAGGYVDRSGVIAFSPDSSRLIAMNRYNGREQAFPIPIWDMETGLPTPALKGQKGDFTCAAFSTDGSILVTCAYNYPPTGGQVAEAWAWDLTTGRTLAKVHMINNQFHAIQFLDHRLFVAFHHNHNNQPYKVYDAVTGGDVRPLEGTMVNQTPSQAVALSPDRRLLAYGMHGYDYGTSDGRVVQGARKTVIWEVASGTIRHELTGFEGMITSLAFSRDGRTLATGCSDTTILLWDLAGKPEKVEALRPADLDAAWKALDETGGRIAEVALRKLAARPAEAVPFLKEQLKPVPGVKPEPEKITKMITDLDSPRYAVREAAMRDLARLGAFAREPVQEALKKLGLTPEVRARLEKVADWVNKPDTGPEWIRPLRAVEALERIGTPDAIAHLKELAAGGDAPPTRVAKEALARLQKDK